MRFCPQCAAPLADQFHAGRNRAVCPAPDCGFVHWDNPLPVVAAIIEYLDGDGRVLLARNAAWPVEFYALITGFLERDESPEEAVAREVKEETNLDAESVALIGLYPFHRKNELILAYHVQARGEIVLNEELAAYKLVPPAELVPWEGGTGWALRDWMRDRGLMA
ncbi:NUDIX hydrolase [Denitratisoma oestradiolicum]|uniref:NADH pyrophosphatase n=1 Tax=Denitratisoma oestradiolicum TaxID=311182 RepID=A0A6S6YBR3_9PROT|nr:NUDIX hydrolase [Denitratisoma oestradiolicum]TWO80089.1 NADH pyrophosphatase [Denitratisoma oestradiolicum]CAB1370076.1 NADH pyrophosphatase [Denitratisoma oestradiolicum]